MAGASGVVDTRPNVDRLVSDHVDQRVCIITWCAKQLLLILYDQLTCTLLCMTTWPYLSFLSLSSSLSQG